MSNPYQQDSNSYGNAVPQMWPVPGGWSNVSSPMQPGRVASMGTPVPLSMVPWHLHLSQQCRPAMVYLPDECAQYVTAVYIAPTLNCQPFLTPLPPANGTDRGNSPNQTGQPLEEPQPDLQPQFLTFEELNELCSVSESGICTPEMSPRYRAPGSSFNGSDNNPYFNSTASSFPLGETEAAGNEDSFLEACCAADDFLESCCAADEASDGGKVPDWAFSVCWDYIPQDPNNYAASDASTRISLSRSARRRRGRRSAKAKARSATVIQDAPPISELSVSPEMKDDMTQQLQTGGSARKAAISKLRGSVMKLSLESHGCRVVQSALDLAGSTEREQLAAELHGKTRDAIASPNANFVIQKVIEVLPVASASFVAEELIGCAVDVARHRYGCRVLCRLVEHHSCCKENTLATNILIEELLLDAGELLVHNFARHVIELILEHGNEAHRSKIASALQRSIFQYAKNRCASYVFEKALAFCAPKDVYALTSKLVSSHEELLSLAMHECGIHVIKALVMLRSEHSASARRLLLAHADELRASKFGKRLLEEI